MCPVVTINDVAREAGVSKTTVSYVISGNPRISDETAARVRRAMADLGYMVNRAARALSTSKTMAIGLMVDAADAKALSITRGVYLCELSEYARRHGYDLLLMTSDDGVRTIRDVASARKVDGLILMDIDRDDPRVRAAVEAKLPTVLLGVPADSLGLDEVDTDFERAARELVALFADRGHRRIALVHTVEHPCDGGVDGVGVDVIVGGHDRSGVGDGGDAGVGESAVVLGAADDGGANYAVRFRRALFAEAAGRGIEVCMLGDEAASLDPGERLRVTLDRFPGTTGLVIDDDQVVIAASQVFMELGIAVPGDLSVAVVVPDVLREQMRIPYTAIDINLPAVAEETVETLVRRLERADAPAVTRLVSQPLLDQGTVRAV